MNSAKVTDDLVLKNLKNDVSPNKDSYSNCKIKCDIYILYNHKK